MPKYRKIEKDLGIRTEKYSQY